LGRGAQKEVARGALRSKDVPMPNYEICYIDSNGRLAFKFAAHCEDANRAKVLAHAMKRREHKGLEVWDDKASLVYRRPSNVEDLSD
jgi:hypothetical protein